MTKEDFAKNLVLSVETSVDDDFLYNHPHVIKGSFVLFCCLNNDGNWDVISNTVLNTFDMSKSEMFEHAIENSKNLYPVLVEPPDAFADISSSVQNSELVFPSDGVNVTNWLVLSKEDYFYGTASLFYQSDILKRISEKLGCDELYIVPLSKHTTLCVPSSNLLSLEELQVSADMLFNEIEDPSDKLISNVMVYDYSNDRIKENNGITYSTSLKEDLQINNVTVSAKPRHL